MFSRDLQLAWTNFPEGWVPEDLQEIETKEEEETLLEADLHHERNQVGIFWVGNLTFISFLIQDERSASRRQQRGMSKSRENVSEEHKKQSIGKDFVNFYMGKLK